LQRATSENADARRKLHASWKAENARLVSALSLSLCRCPCRSLPLSRPFSRDFANVADVLLLLLPLLRLRCYGFAAAAAAAALLLLRRTSVLLGLCCWSLGHRSFSRRCVL